MKNGSSDNGRKKQLRDDKWSHALRTFYETLDMLGESPKKALLHVLEHDYKISFSEIECSPPEQIESALRSILGPGAEIIIKTWKEKSLV